MQQRALGRTGLKVSRLGPRHDDLGPRHRRARGARAADRLRRGRRHPASTPRPATPTARSEELLGSLLGDVVAPRRGRARHQGRDLARAAAARVLDTSRGYLLSTLDASLQRLGVDHVDLWQVHVWFDDDARSRRRSAALDFAVSDRPRGVRRDLQLHRLADRARPRPGSGPCRAGRRWPRPRWSTRCSTAGSSTRCCRPRRRSASACCPGRRWAGAC